MLLCQLPASLVEGQNLPLLLWLAHYVAPLFTHRDSSCRIGTNGRAGRQRGRRLVLPEVIWVHGGRQPLPFPRRPVLHATRWSLSQPTGERLVTPLRWFQTCSLQSDQECLKMFGLRGKSRPPRLSGKRECRQEATTNQTCCCKQTEADIWYPAACERQRTAQCSQYGAAYLKEPSSSSWRRYLLLERLEWL